MAEEGCVTSFSAMKDPMKDVCLGKTSTQKGCLHVRALSPPYFLNILTGYYFFPHPIGFYGWKGEGGKRWLYDFVWNFRAALILMNLTRKPYDSKNNTAFPPPCYIWINIIHTSKPANPCLTAIPRSEQAQCCGIPKCLMFTSNIYMAFCTVIFHKKKM